MPTKVTDPAILAQLNGGGTPAPQAGPIYGAPTAQPKPDLPQGWQIGPDGSAQPIPGLPASQTNPTFRTLSPDEIKTRGLDPSHVWQIGTDGKVADVGNADASKQAEDAALFKLMGVIKALNDVGLDVRDNSVSPGLGETGTSGRFMRGVPGVQTAGKDLAGNLKTLDANFAFDALQAMRDASKTGGALGQVSEMELGLLRSATANLDPNLSQDAFTKNVEGARQVYLAKLAMISPELATRLGYDPKKAEAEMLQLNDAYNKAAGVNISQMTPRHEATGSERHPADIEAIMQKYGAN